MYTHIYVQRTATSWRGSAGSTIPRTHICIYVHTRMNTIYVYINTCLRSKNCFKMARMGWEYNSTKSSMYICTYICTVWRSCVECLKLQFSCAKEPTIIGLFCRKWPEKKRHLMGLRHSVYVICIFTYICGHRTDSSWRESAENTVPRTQICTYTYT